MNDSLAYLIPILTLVLGVVIGINTHEPIPEVFKIVLENKPDTIYMSLTGCIDMIGR